MKKHAYLGGILIFLLTSCEYVSDTREIYNELTTNKLWTFTMEPRNKFEQIYKLDRKNKNPKRFDIIEFEFDDEFYDKNDFYSSNHQVSRVIGLPNETIELKMGVVYINDTILDQPFLVDSCLSKDNFPRTKINDKCFFLMVDNRKLINSDSVTDVRYKPYDSRLIGTIHVFKIVGITNLK